MANIDAVSAATGKTSSTQRCDSRYTVSAKNISLDKKPLSSGTPAMAALATSASVPVMGMSRIRPLKRRMSRVPVS